MENRHPALVDAPDVPGPGDLAAVDRPYGQAERTTDALVVFHLAGVLPAGAAVQQDAIECALLVVDPEGRQEPQIDEPPGRRVGVYDHESGAQGKAPGGDGGGGPPVLGDGSLHVEAAVGQLPRAPGEPERIEVREHDVEALVQKRLQHM